MNEESNGGAKSKRPARASCFVSGTMYLMLRVTRVVGLAPVRFEQRLSGLRVFISPALCRLYFGVVTVINVGTFLGLVLDLLEPYEENSTRFYIWTAAFMVMMVQVGISVYRAPGRLKAVIKCLDLVNKIAIERSHAQKTSEKNWRYVFIVTFSASALTLVVLDFISYVFESIAEGMTDHVIGMYSCQYAAMLLIQFMEMQFVITGMEVQSALVAYNDLLEEVTSLIKEQGENLVIPDSVVNKVTANSYGCMADDIMYYQNKSSGSHTSDLSRPHEMFRVLHIKHFQLCGVVRSLSNHFGPEILSVLAACMIHLMCSPNFILMFLSSGEDHTCGIALEVVWVMWYLFCTYAIVEQGHKAQAQMGRTAKLVSDLVLVKTDELLQGEVRKFSAFLILNRVAYTPMDACTLNRGLAVAILGSITTYLVIIYQFQQAEIKRNQVT